ncbi:MAG: pseudouridine synthase [Lachnospiraceae bacterium]|nr:pseudouridine synthase [Lachnospiraceae bacterium]
MKKQIRLDKYLAELSVGTRSQVKQLIRKGLVQVNGITIKAPEHKVDVEHDQVMAQGKMLCFVQEEYIMLHKPAGVVSATKDKNEKTVLDLIKGQKRKDLFPAGRLDKDTEGLLLLTSDGELAHQLLSPKKHVDKTYYARIQGRVTKEDQKAFLQGLDIGDEKKTFPAKLEILVEDDISEIRITIQEGRFHQVKRMFEAREKKVIYLKRLSMGTLLLDEQLDPGQYRHLTEEEIRTLKGE